VPECTYPVTGLGCVDRVYTDVATFAIEAGRVSVAETFGTSVDELAGRLDLDLGVF
jgi:3-oxoadipate CoA-transferase beta subunit